MRLQSLAKDLPFRKRFRVSDIDVGTNVFPPWSNEVLFQSMFYGQCF